MSNLYCNGLQCKITGRSLPQERFELIDSLFLRTGVELTEDQLSILEGTTAGTLKHLVEAMIGCYDVGLEKGKDYA